MCFGLGLLFAFHWLKKVCSASMLVDFSGRCYWSAFSSLLSGSLLHSLISHFPSLPSHFLTSTVAGSACLVGYKKTPPPVPPRTTSKPFISVTVQSSTESAQDNYLDNQDHKSEVNSQSGLSNSSDSLDSTRPPSVTKGSIVTPVREPPELPLKNAALKSDKGTLTNEEPNVESIPKRKLSSIGIQVRNVLFSLALENVLNVAIKDVLPCSTAFTSQPAWPPGQVWV